VVFYALIIVMPLTGWSILSAHQDAKWLSLFGIPWPPLPIGDNLALGAVEKLHDAAVTAHSWLTVQILLGLLALHVGAVVKHHLFDGHPTIKRMLPRFGGSH
jgi:cytochrome b561